MSKIIKNADSVVVYAGDTLELTAQNATNGEWIDRSTTGSNAVLVEDVELPSDWQGGHYTFIGGVWARTAAGAEALADRLADDKAARWEDIKVKRDDLKINGGYKVVVAGVDKWFHSDTFSRTQQIGLVMLGANIPPDLQWKCMDGSFVTMTQALASAVFQAAAAQDMAIFAQAETHKAAMEASADPAAYDFSAGWPATFPG